jgi:hypothetical protein
LRRALFFRLCLCDILFIGKAFLVGVVIFFAETHNSNKDKPFRFQFDDLPVKITLVEG